MNRDRMEDIRNGVKKIIFQSSRQGIDPDIFTLAFSCLCRTPSIGQENMLSFLEAVQSLLEKKIDYNLLLKAGMLTVKFPDYQNYEITEFLNQYIEGKKSQLQQELEKIMAQLNMENTYIYGSFLHIPLNIGWLQNLKLAYRIYAAQKQKNIYCHFWEQLSQTQKRITKAVSPDNLSDDPHCFLNAFSLIISKIEQNELKRVRDLLNLNSNEWRIELDPKKKSADTAHEILVSKTSSPDYQQFISTKIDNPYDRQSMPGIPHYVSNHKEFSEEMEFIAIYQNYLCPIFGFRSPVKDALEHYFEVTTGKKPSKTELGTLHRRYYRFIRKAYPVPFASNEDIKASTGQAETMRALTTFQPDRRNVFYLAHGKGKKYQERNHATLKYDVRNRRFWLVAGSQLANDLDSIADSGVAVFIEQNLTRRKIQILADGSYRVLKKIEVKSPSKAAWLVCGYKRNGLNCWENGQNQTLREYLTSIGHTPVKKVSSKSGSSHPENQEEHLSAGDSTVQELR